MNTEKMIFKCHKSLVHGYARTVLNYNLLLDHPLPEGPKILVANHPTTSDPFLLPLLVDEPIQILVTEMAFEVPVFGKLLHAGGHIPVCKTHSNGTQIINAAVRRLAEGGTIGLFPEGSLSPSIGTFCKAHTGAARIALQSGAPVIPVGIHLSPDAYLEKVVKTDNFEETARFACRGSYYVTIGSPLHLNGDVGDWEYVRAASNQIMQAIITQARKSELRMSQKLQSWQPLFRGLSGNKA